MFSLKKAVAGVLSCTMLLGSLVISGCSDSNTSGTQSADNTSNGSSTAHQGEIKDISSVELVKDMKIGWSLGNTLDAGNENNRGQAPGAIEKSWGNPDTTKEMIDEVKNAGFNVLRVPTTWDWSTGDAPDYKISDEWLARVKEVVDYGMENDMYVILNIHHDTSTQYYYPSSTYKTQSVKFVKSIWTQVAKYFKDYDQHLVFETLNEPRLIGTGDEWWFPVNNPNSAVLDSIKVINTLNQTAVDAIRSAGGKNSDRCIMVPGYCASIDGCTTSAFKLPTDKTSNRLIVSVHAYTPYNFALNGSGTSTFSDNLKSEVDYLFNMIKSKLLDKGVPVVIGETSASNKNGNSAERVKWAKYYFGKAKTYGVPCVLWDNNVYNGNDKGECHGHLNRKTLGWYDKNFVDAVINPSGSLSAVSGFKVKGQSSTSVTLQWNKNTAAGGYIIEQQINNTWKKIADIKNNTTTTYTVKGLKAGTANYKFRMKAYKGTATSSYTSAVSTNTNPYGVGGFKVKSQSSTAITLTWNKGTTASGYVIERYDGSKWVHVARINSASTTSYTVRSLKAGTSYQFKIRAFKSYSDKNQYGTWSTPLKANTNPYGVGGFNVKSTNKTSVTLGWNKGTSASGYVIERYDGSKWVHVARINKASTTSYTVRSLKAGTKYQFRIRAFKSYPEKNQYGTWSKTLTATTKK